MTAAVFHLEMPVIWRKTLEQLSGWVKLPETTSFIRLVYMQARRLS